MSRMETPKRRQLRYRLTPKGVALQNLLRAKKG